MGNNYISISSLPFLSDVLDRRESMIMMLIDEISYNQLENQSDFDREQARLEKEVLFVPVELGEVEFVACEVINTSSTSQMKHKMSVPFTGDKVLFTCSPARKSTTVGKSTIIIPIQKSIVVNVALDVYDPETAIQEAKHQLSETILLLKKNNATVIDWNLKVKQIIKDKLIQKRDQFVNKRKAQTYSKETKSASL